MKLCIICNYNKADRRLLNGMRIRLCNSCTIIGRDETTFLYKCDTIRQYISRTDRIRWNITKHYCLQQPMLDRFAKLRRQYDPTGYYVTLWQAVDKTQQYGHSALGWKL